jgi:aspartokinase/homoserine dehydrogenase 1
MDASSTLFEINGIFSRLLAGLKAAYPALDDKALQARFTAELDQVERLMQGIRLLGLCPDNVQARILSRGENLSIAFMHELLRVRGIELISSCPSSCWSPMAATSKPMWTSKPPGCASPPRACA